MDFVVEPSCFFKATLSFGAPKRVDLGFLLFSIELILLGNANQTQLGAVFVAEGLEPLHVGQPIVN